MVAALMEDTSQRYVDAMLRIVRERHPGPHGVRHWEALENLMSTQPIARLEYRYKRNGTEMLRTYDGMNGGPLSQNASDILEGAVLPGTPDSLESFDEWASAPPLDTERLARVDIDEDRYFSDEEARKRARILPEKDSVMRPYAIDGSQRALDAEFKVTRQLENDILAGTVPRGGRVSLYTTNTLCNSCETSLKTVSSAYDLDMRVTLMRQRLSPAERSQLLSSGQVRSRGTTLIRNDSGRPYLASDVVANARERQVKRILTPAFRSERGLTSGAAELLPSARCR
ncbi:hypothetical protein KCV01_g609, partial [Aureobasidium melanogenum]